MKPTSDAFPRIDSGWQPLAVIPRQPARAGYNLLPSGTSYPPMLYDDFDLWLGLEGRSTVEVLGRSHPLDAKMSLLLPPGVSAIQSVPPDTDFRMAYFHFDLAYQGQVLRDARRYVKAPPASTTESQTASRSAARPILSLPGLPMLALFATLDTTRLAERLMRAVRRWDHVAQLESLALITGALTEHCRELVRPAGGHGRGSSAVDAALEYLDDNLHQAIYVEDVAAHVRLSPTHLTRLFRLQLKETPMQALLRMRLSRALSLMREPVLNISEVASACGFESLSYFTRVFAQKYGCPPTAYRRSLQRR